MSTGIFPEVLSQQILVGIILVGSLGVFVLAHEVLRREKQAKNIKKHTNDDNTQQENKTL